MSASVWQAVKLQHALQDGRDLAGEHQRDMALAERVTAQTDEAIAYDHASHGCPFAEDGTCSVCDNSDEEIFI